MICSGLADLLNTENLHHCMDPPELLDCLFTCPR